MPSRLAAPQRAAPHSARPRSRRRAGDSRKLIEALTTLETFHRDALLEAVAMAAQELLRTTDLRKSLPKIAERIGSAAGVDRTHIFLVEGGRGDGHIEQHCVWTVPGLVTPAEFRNPTSPMAEAGLKRWLPRLQRGETISGHTRDFDPAARALFERGGVQSVLSVPVFAGGQWRGLIGFDDCRSERDWSTAEIDIIKTMAELVGAAIARTAQLKDLADANRIVENSTTILYRADPQPPYPLSYLSQNVSRYGYRAEDLLADPGQWMHLIVSDDMPILLRDTRALAEGKADTLQCEFRIRTPQGAIAWFECRGSALHDGKGRVLALEGILTDITERKLAAEKIAKLARTDSLTGLPNRAAFLERLALEFARAKRGDNRFAVHYLDLDHFKDVNDTLGHPVGDALLQAVAERLKACLRETDMVARFGGDEFAVLQDDLSEPGGAEALAAKIGEVMALPYAIDGNELRTTVSIGIVPFSRDLAGPDAMIMKADLALYRAKDDGRNQFRFHAAELDEETRERMVIGEGLRHAIKRNELELFYQPQVEIASGNIVGMEALIRWHHPERGLLLPAAFMPIAETTGSILPIGEWMIERVCRQIKAWAMAGIAPPIVAANISAAQFKLAPGLDRLIAKNLARFNVAPNQLELELTETVLMETTQKHSEEFDRLRQIGVQIAIDDFGTGYSSLDYLRSFRVSRLKIDRRFINDVTSNPDDATIVRATVSLAHALGIMAVAEDVETAEQKDFLIAAGCTLAQGGYFGEAVPVAMAGELLRQKICNPPSIGPASAPRAG